MAYIDGFVIAVPTVNKQKFIDHAKKADAVFVEKGATRIVETWEDDVKDGKVTDFRRAVQATEDESIVFSWIEWPDKATRDSTMEWMTGEGMNDPRMDQKNNPMPFDGKRMIFGGFEPFVDELASGKTGYVDGFVTPVTPGNREAYVAMADKSAAMFLETGAIRSSENWGNDVSDGKVTDFKRSVKAEGDEAVVFSWIEWPDKATRDAGWEKVMADESMRPDTMPFDGKRMVWGGFEPVVVL